MSSARNRELFVAATTELIERFVYVSDSRQYGKRERWEELQQVGDKLAGDCEDFCITLARMANERGVPKESMRLHIVDVPNAGWHVVLECEGLIADCNSALVKSIDDEFYFRWDSQRQLDQEKWSKT